MFPNIGRVHRTEQEAADSYTRLSRWYDRLGRGSEEPHIAEGLRLLSVRPGARVLEVGFGTGRSLIALAHAVGPTGQVVGIDLSPGMIAVTREQLRKDAAQSSFPRASGGNPASRLTPSGCPTTALGHDGIVLHRGSALHLPFVAATFDAVFSSFMLDLIDTPDIPIVLGEMRRVSKPGGHVGLVSMSKACEGNVVVRIYERFHRWLPKLIDCRPIYLQSAVELAGLRCEAHQTRSMWGIPVEIVVAKR